MKCPKCQAINTENRHFCKRCGSRLLFNCPQCGFANEVGDTYCGGCGKLFSEAVSTSPPQAGAPSSQKPSHSNLPNAFLEEMLSEASENQTDTKKEDKKAVTQEEIDKLFNK